MGLTGLQLLQESEAEKLLQESAINWILAPPHRPSMDPCSADQCEEWLEML